MTAPVSENELRNRLRRLANLLDPNRRLRALPQRLRARRFLAEHVTLSAAAAGDAIARRIADGAPAAIGKIGNSELRVLTRWRRATEQGRPPRFPDWLRGEALIGPGVFPTDDDALARFAAFWLEGLRSVDMLAVWHNRGEAEIVDAYCPAADYVEFETLEPYLLAQPWTRALTGRRVAVVTPFPLSVRAQYARRREVWGAADVLPAFDLQTIEAPLSPALVPARHPDWFARLDDVTERLERTGFDVALIGAGAMSIPLCARAKAMGRIGIHTGGATQVLFGVRGRRFDAERRIAPLMNSSWIRPLPEETPDRWRLVENGAYW